jgi:hypothetical protein
MAQDARVVIKHLDEDIAPEPAQPLALRSMAAALSAAWLTVSNACICTPAMVSIACAAGRHARPYSPRCCWLPWARIMGNAGRELQRDGDEQ